MNLDEIISELLRQRQWLDNAILCLSKVQKTRNRRGRPPKWLTQARANGLLEMENPTHNVQPSNETNRRRMRSNGACQVD
jgi:hypothetical protein